MDVGVVKFNLNLRSRLKAKFIADVYTVGLEFALHGDDDRIMNHNPGSTRKTMYPFGVISEGRYSNLIGWHILQNERTKL